MTKKMGCLLVFLAVGGIGAIVTSMESSRESARRDALTPEQRAAEDSTRAAAEKAGRDSARRALERTPGHQKGLAEFALKQRMKDPESAQFRDERMYTRGDTLVVCGEVNAKNSFGGYTGFKAFVSINGAAVTEDDAGELGAKVVNAMFAMCEDSE